MSERDPVVSSAVDTWAAYYFVVLCPWTLPKNRIHQDLRARDIQMETAMTGDSKLEFLENTRKGLVELLSSYGIILTLLASITFVAVLQPPGSFDPDGFVRSSKLVAAFMFFATSSFLLACTGLLTVAVGSAMMLRPRFFKPFEEIQVPPHTHHPHKCQPLSPDVTSIMGKNILDNLYRIRRIRIYMGLSMLSCVTAFLCAGFVVTKSSSHGFYSLVAAIVLGGFPFLLEIVKIFMRPAFSWRNVCGLHDRISQFILEKTISTKLQAISDRHRALVNAQASNTLIV